MLAMLLALGGSVFAFSDIKGDPGEADIRALKERGILSGMDKGKFAPKGQLSYAEGVVLTVKAFGLNIDNIRFIKAPVASDYFTKVPNDAWYADEFIIAHLNGLPIPKDVNPTSAMTREQFADLLIHGMLRTGEYAFIEIFMLIGDEAKITPERMSSIQTLLIAKIAELDKDQNFRPQEIMTRSETAKWVHNAVKFVEENRKTDPGTPVDPDRPVTSLDVKVTTSEAAKGVNRVVLTGELPHPGYGFAIESITFTEDTALIRYRVIDPDPDKMYIQVVTEAKVETFVDAKYKIVTEQAR